MRSILYTGVAVVSALALGGCPGQTGNTQNTGGGHALTPGIYSGNVGSTLSVYNNGALVQQTSGSLSVTETVNADGLTQLSTGAPLQNGDQIVLGQAGANVVLGTIDSVTEADNRLTVAFTITGQVNGLNVSGTGQATYTAVDSNTIDFHLSTDFSGTDASGRVIRQTEDQQGTLSR
jgi:hypothetical protein